MGEHTKTQREMAELREVIRGLEKEKSQWWCQRHKSVQPNNKKDKSLLNLAVWLSDDSCFKGGWELEPDGSGIKSEIDKEKEDTEIFEKGWKSEKEKEEAGGET